MFLPDLQLGHVIVFSFAAFAGGISAARLPKQLFAGLAGVLLLATAVAWLNGTILEHPLDYVPWAAFGAWVGAEARLIASQERSGGGFHRRSGRRRQRSSTPIWLLAVEIVFLLIVLLIVVNR
jgi:hypothetical protein